MNEQELYIEAIRQWGAEAQLAMVVEECAELITAVLHCLRGRNANVPEEIADVEIMLGQLRLMFDPNLIDQHKTAKLKRLRKRLEMEDALEVP